MPYRDTALTRLHKIDTSRVGATVRPRNKPRGIPPALEPHLRYETSEPGEAAVLGRELFGHHRLTVLGDRRRFNATLHAVLMRDVTLAHLDYGTETTVHVGALPGDFLILVPASGHAVVSFGSEHIESSPILAVLPPPGSPMTIACGPHTAHVLLRIDRRALEAHLARLLGHRLDQALRFDPRLDLSASVASRWNFAVQMFHAELFDPDSLLHSGIGIGPLEEFLMSALLYSQPSNHWDELHGLTTRPTHPAVRAARNHIAANLRQVITLSDLADSAGVSVRTLQAAFQADLDTTPMAFVRQQRLERVRATLADASASARPTVGSVATDWGFTHLGRFAAAYRERFGESPSETLRR